MLVVGTPGGKYRTSLHHTHVLDAGMLTERHFTK